eukprot:gnl/Dysnectes_brevis/1288_a1444_3240.p1 GENE.gnl/Dysnectes_brevis/1288_a1444_3240~~gnl/Dysnectes_brevis/1288_a1444_3240.p1  ORF type:complete len:579 (-),score=102.07 gnl/Dysnectes_brevis/1288_a1444_3240:44-1780(-)
MQKSSTLRHSDKSFEVLEPIAAPSIIGEVKEENKAQTSAFLLNTMLGAALLSFPRVVADCGIIFSVLLSVLGIIFCSGTYKAIVYQTYRCNGTTLRQVVNANFNSTLALSYDISLCLLYLGVLVAYLNISSDYFYIVLDSIFDTVPSQVQMKVIVSVFVLIPFTLIPNISFLSSISSLAVVFILVTILSVAVRLGGALVSGDQWQGIPFLPASPTAPIRYISVFLSLYGCQGSLPPLYSELRGAPPSRLRLINGAISAALPIVFGIYVVMSVSSLGLFGQDVANNVLLSFPAGDTWMTIVRLLMAAVIATSYPTILFPLRKSVLVWITPRNKTAGYGSYAAVGCFVTGLCLVLAVKIPNITVIFSFSTAAFGTLCYWVIPFLLWAKMPSREARDGALSGVGAEGGVAPRESLAIPTLALLLRNTSGTMMTRLRAISSIRRVSQSRRTRSATLSPQSLPDSTITGASRRRATSFVPTRSRAHSTLDGSAAGEAVLGRQRRSSLREMALASESPISTDSCSVSSESGDVVSSSDDGDDSTKAPRRERGDSASPRIWTVRIGVVLMVAVNALSLLFTTLEK